ncbi:MAG: ribonuclease P protein component [bacterium]
MLPRKFRLAKHADITAAIRQGKRLVTPYTNIHYLPTACSHTRIACIVSKKVSPSAVQRHKYQRWLRVCAYNIVSKQTAYDMVWIAGPKITQLANQAELQQKLQPYLSKL